MAKERFEARLLRWIRDENPNITLEYGVPLENVPYEIIYTIIGDSRYGGLLERAIELVEQENKKGKPGAFVTTRDDWDSDELDEIIEVWSWQKN